jgi:hypothetical protein
MESVETNIKTVEKSFEAYEDWIAKAENLLVRRLIRLKDTGRLGIVTKKN